MMVTHVMRWVGAVCCCNDYVNTIIYEMTSIFESKTKLSNLNCFLLISFRYTTTFVLLRMKYTFIWYVSAGDM